MPRKHKRGDAPLTRWRPGDPTPVNVDAATAAAIVTQEFFPVSPRTIEAWPIPVRKPNGKKIYAVHDLKNYAQWLLDREPVMKQAAGASPFAGA
jgi:hypothetical protein